LTATILFVTSCSGLMLIIM